jgi:hypothetical protein
LPDKRIAILWRDSAIMANADQAEYESAIEVLGDCAVLLGDVKATVGQPKQVSVVVT